MQLRTLYLIRHGQTDWNTSGRWQGTLPVALNVHGREQAQYLAKALRTRPITQIYSSDLPRALETAQIVGQSLNLVPIPDERLREMHLGLFQGLTRDEILARHATEFHASQEDYLDYVIPNGESRRALMVRALEMFREVVTTQQTQHEEIALVSHGVTLKMLLTGLFPQEEERLRHSEIGNTSVTTLRRDTQDWYLADLANMNHLSDAATEMAADHGEAKESTEA